MTQAHRTTHTGLRFHHVVIVGKYQAPGSRDVVSRLADFLHDQGCEVSLEEETALNTGLHHYQALNVAGIGAQCDLAVAARTARFAVSGVNLGLFCATPSVALSRNLSRKAAFEMLVTGAFISAEQAQAKGLINRVVEADQLDAEIEALVASIVAKPRVALAMGKGLFYRQLETGIEEAYADAGETMACNMMDGSALEGVQAFIDKRSPDWRGAL
jgi:enoyl-CoA hydratase/carnithine racemase